jgi:hypothetical protein
MMLECLDRPVHSPKYSGIWGFILLGQALPSGYCGLYYWDRPFPPATAVYTTGTGPSLGYCGLYYWDRPFHPATAVYTTGIGPSLRLLRFILLGQALPSGYCGFSCRSLLSKHYIFLATVWKVRGSNPVGGEIFDTRPDRPWGPPSHLNNANRVFTGGNATGAWPLPPTPSSTEVKERVELYLYSPTWP